MAAARGLALPALAALLCACGGPTRFMRGGGEVTALNVREVDWNPAHAEVGRVTAVADAGDEVLVLGDHGATFFTGGRAVGADRQIMQWQSAAAIPAADRQATWLVGIEAASGRMYRAKARSTMEAISDRYTVTSWQVSRAAPLGGDLVGLAFVPSNLLGMKRPFAIADGQEVTIFEGGPAGDLAGGGGKAAWAGADEVRVFDVKRRALRVFSLRGAARAALDTAGRLYAATAHEVYAEDGTGTLTLVYETATEGATITGLVTSGTRVWFSEGADLGVILERQVSITAGLKRPAGASLAASSSGDVWSLAGGALARYAVDGSAPRRAQWEQAVRPAFERACVMCHGPSAPAGLDLSTFDAWEAKGALIRSRVFETGDMPPAGRPLDDADRRVIDEWTAPGAAATGH